MTEQMRTTPRRTARGRAGGRTVWRTGGRTAVAVLALLVAAGCTSGRSAKAPVEVRGSDPAARTTTTAPPPAAGGGGGIVTNGKDRYVVAERGDTVASLARRHGLSASELAAYNGLTPDTGLFVGQDLVVPPGAGTTGARVADAGTGGGLDTRPGSGGRVESRPLPGAGTGAGAGGVPVGADGTIPGTGDATNDTTAAAGGGSARSGWSPDRAAAAIERSGETGLKKNGRLGAPPSSTDPVPDGPTAVPTLESPDLGKYQTRASSGDPAAGGGGSPDVAALDRDKAGAAGAGGGRTVRLQRPVEGPIAVGFGQGAGPAKNEGVDFAAPAGAPVVAADHGEVALVSETLGGLGTIVLVRHKEELLTVYGRIDQVTVKKGDTVRRGQKIGVVSDAAAPAEPRMHFEVRRGATVLDPMGFL